MAIDKGFPNMRAYERYHDDRRRQRPEYMAYSTHLKIRLAELGKGLIWLEEQSGIRSSTLGTYTTGVHLPKSPRRELLLSILDSPFKSLDEVVAAYHKSSQN